MANYAAAPIHRRCADFELWSRMASTYLMSETPSVEVETSHWFTYGLLNREGDTPTCRCSFYLPNVSRRTLRLGDRQLTPATTRSAVVWQKRTASAGDGFLLEVEETGLANQMRVAVSLSWNGERFPVFRSRAVPLDRVIRVIYCPRKTPTMKVDRSPSKMKKAS